MRGIFIIPVTPFDKEGKLDVDSLKKEVDFCIQSRVHGIVVPVGASEFSFLSDNERKEVIETVIQQVNGKVPVVAGIAAPCKELVVPSAKHANDAGADAVIALPPYIAKANYAEMRDYYKAIAEAVDIPIFIQNGSPPQGSALTPDFICKLASEIGEIEYVKEETPPAGPRIANIIRKCGSNLKGVFSGSGGQWMLDEKERGACGCMPACFVPDLHVRVWEFHEAGKNQQARDLFNILLPIFNLRSIPQYSLPVAKEILVRRGILAASYVRQPGTKILDELDKNEFDKVWENIRPLCKV